MTDANIHDIVDNTSHHLSILIHQTHVHNYNIYIHKLAFLNPFQSVKSVQSAFYLISHFSHLTSGNSQFGQHSSLVRYPNF